MSAMEMTADEQRRFVRALQDCLDIRDEADFKRFALGPLAALMPYAYFACAIGPFDQPRVQTLINVNFHPGLVSRTVTQSGKVNSRLFKAWCRVRQPLCFDREYFARSDPEWYDVLNEFDLHNICGHGIQDLGSSVGAYFSFGDMGCTRNPLHRHYIQLLSPHLYFAVQRMQNRSHQEKESFRFSPRQKEILRWVALGKSSWEIGMLLNISERTVSIHIARAMQKLQVHNRAHAVAKAISLGIITL